MARPRKYDKKPTIHQELYTETVERVSRLKRHWHCQNTADTIDRIVLENEQFYREIASLREENRILKDRERAGNRIYFTAQKQGIEMTGGYRVPQLVQVLAGKSSMYEPATGFWDVYRC